MKDIKHHITRRFYDSHANLPLDPDSGQPVGIRPMHTDWPHTAVVGFGAFFGTLARYQMGIWLPAAKNGWPMATFLINISGAFVLGLVLQALLHRGKDEGARRIARLLAGTGFLGAFTTYSSLATGAALLAGDGYAATAALYAVLSIAGGIIAAAVGIRVATARHARRGSA